MYATRVLIRYVIGEERAALVSRAQKRMTEQSRRASLGHAVGSDYLDDYLTELAALSASATLSPFPVVSKT
jgi:hypothetical protein